jgi:hypothetical protein
MIFIIMGNPKFDRFLEFIDETNFDADEKIIQFIDALPKEVINQFDEYKATDLHHYCKLQSIWIKDCEYYLGQKLKRKPSIQELTDEYFAHCIRFRAFYAIKFKNKVEH